MVFERVDSGNPCPICGKEKYCLFLGHGILCTRTKSPKRMDAFDGWFHPTGKKSRQRRRGTSLRVPVVLHDWQGIHHRCVAAITPPLVKQLAVRLCVSVDSLHRFGVGWDSETGSYTFPIAKANGVICGIQRRRLTGFKYVFKGSDIKGLFVPTGLSHDRVLFIAEGVSDACHLLSCGLQAIARFSKGTPPRLCYDFIRRGGYRHAVAVADTDADGGGLRSAEAVVELCRLCSDCRLLIPPGKDVRDSRMTRNDIVNQLQHERVLQ